MIEKLFYPKSIAVVGTSENPAKVGYSVLKNIKESFKGEVYPVNPKAEEILGLKTYKSVSDIPESFDLVVIIVPAAFVSEVLKESGKKGVKAGIVISAGFREIGKQGEELEKQITEIAEKYKISLLGPNCLGLLNSDNKLNAAFVIDGIKKGKTAFVSQSGALCTAIIDWAQEQDFGFSKFVSIGNKAVLDESDLLEYLNKDKETEVILMYLETIKNGKKFMKEAMESDKPIVLLKAGKTDYGKKAAMSHTGSMISGNEIYKAVYKKTGIIEAETIEEMFEICKLLIEGKKAKPRTLGIITNAGGVGVISADSAFGEGILLPEIDSKKIKEKLPRASGNNPLDVIGDAKSEDYKKAIELFLESEKIGSLLILLTPQSVTEIEETAKEIIKASKKNNKPIVACFLGGKRVKEARKILSENKIPNFDFPEKAVKAIAGLMNEKKKYFIHKGEKLNLEEPKSLEESFRLLQKIGIPVANFCTGGKKEITIRARNFRYPSVLKFDANIAHKTEYGIVKIINNEKEFNEGIEKMEKIVRKNKLEGKYILQEKIEGKSIIIGAVKNESFGTVVNLGAGGIYTEVLKDNSLALTPLPRNEIKEMLESLKTYKLLEGVRGEKAVDINSIIEITEKIAEVVENSRIKEMEINPIIVNEKGAWAVDALFKFE